MTGLTPSSYPGGPTVSGADSTKSTRQLKSGEDVEAYRELFAWRGRRSRRGRRLRVGVAAAVLIATLGGVYLGLATHRSAEQLADAVRSEGASPHLTQEADRLMNELWKMEDMERHPRLGR